jgi:hypothetical protein
VRGQGDNTCLTELHLCVFVHRSVFAIFHILRSVRDRNIAVGVFAGVCLGVFVQEGDAD